MVGDAVALFGTRKNGRVRFIELWFFMRFELLQKGAVLQDVWKAFKPQEHLLSFLG